MDIKVAPADVFPSFTGLILLNTGRGPLVNFYPKSLIKFG